MHKNSLENTGSTSVFTEDHVMAQLIPIFCFSETTFVLWSQHALSPSWQLS